MNIEQIAQKVREEMSSAILPQVVGAYEEAFLRRCLSKLAEQEVEPVAHAVLEGRDTADSGWGYIAAWPEACHEHINEAIVEYEVEGAGDWKVVPLYTETQLLAAQQRTAEACAKVCDEIAAAAGIGAGFAEAIRNGEWREYP